jgi:hypothetical protein
VIERVAVLRQYDRKAWFPGTGADGEKLSATSVDGFHRDLQDLVRLRLESGQFRHDTRVAKARQMMGLVLSSWVRDLQRSPPANIDLSSVADVGASIQAWLAQGKTVNEIDRELGQALLSWRAHDVDTFGPRAKTEPRLFLRNKIPIWLWVDAYIKLTEIWLGYRFR